MKEKKQLNVIWIAILGGIAVATVLILGTFASGRRAGSDTQKAVHNVSLLYLDELAQRRQQVVSTTIDGYISDIGIALDLMEPEDLSSTEMFQAYQSRMKQLYRFERFTFVDENGLIYTAYGTRTDIDDYAFDYTTLSGSEVFVKTNPSGEKRVVIAVSVDRLPYEGKTLIACITEINMDVLLSAMSLRGSTNNNTTFCNIYTKDGVALTDAVLGGLASEDNLLGALEHADMNKGYSLEQVKKDFDEHRNGYVSFSYNGIRETLYYVPVKRTDWMLSYLIRENLVAEQIESVSDSILSRSVAQSLLTALAVIVVFGVLIYQLRRNSKMTLERELSEAENRIRQQELEEQVALQEELLDQQKRRAEQDEKLEEALRVAEDASRAKSRFVSNMSHEIRTPITAILGMNEMIQRECEDDTILGYSHTIEKAGTSLLGIISDILDFSKIESGKLELVDVCYNLPAMIRDLYNLIYFRAEGKGLAVELDVDESLPCEVFGDELRVKQIITNLLTNAVKYTEEGRVKLTVRRETEMDEVVAIYIEVADSGMGIRPDEMEKLFSSFERLDTERNRTVEGTGLGLAITNELLAQMGSKLEVESTYDVGSRFYFTLKQGIVSAERIGRFDMDNLLTGTAGRQQKQAPFRAPGARIMIVDDTPMNLQVIAALLKRTGMQIDTASSGAQCIEMFDEATYHMVFLDYRMPGLDGIETVRELALRYPDTFERTPVVALTASAISGDRERMLEAGFTDYLTKPVNVADMENVLRTYLPKVLQVDTPVPVAAAEEDEDEEGEIGKLPKELREISLLDHKKGILYCGDAEDYLFALETYRDSIEERCKKLEDECAASDMETFTIEIHSMKSMSRSIGAESLADRAEELEVLAKDGECEKVAKMLPGFLEEYRGLLEMLNGAL